MTSTATIATPLTWTQLEALTDFELDRVNGPTNAQARLRLFGKTESMCESPCTAITMLGVPTAKKSGCGWKKNKSPTVLTKLLCSAMGKKESWYKRKVPSGMLPAIELDGRIITESDDILIALERVYGPLGLGMENPAVIPMRRLERLLFRAWCSWLCYPASSARVEQHNRDQFISVVAQVEKALASTPGALFPR
jgi:glutathione S-transferase